MDVVSQHTGYQTTKSDDEQLSFTVTSIEERRPRDAAFKWKIATLVVSVVAVAFLIATIAIAKDHGSSDGGNKGNPAPTTKLGIYNLLFPCDTTEGADNCCIDGSCWRSRCCLNSCFSLEGDVRRVKSDVNKHQKKGLTEDQKKKKAKNCNEKTENVLDKAMRPQPKFEVIFEEQGKKSVPEEVLEACKDSGMKKLDCWVKETKNTKGAANYAACHILGVHVTAGLLRWEEAGKSSKMSPAEIHDVIDTLGEVLKETRNYVVCPQQKLSETEFEKVTAELGTDYPRLADLHNMDYLKGETALFNVVNAATEGTTEGLKFDNKGYTERKWMRRVCDEIYKAHFQNKQLENSIDELQAHKCVVPHSKGCLTIKGTKLLENRVSKMEEVIVQCMNEASP